MDDTRKILREAIQDAAAEQGEEITEEEEHRALDFLATHLESMGVQVMTREEHPELWDALMGDDDDPAPTQGEEKP